MTKSNAEPGQNVSEICRQFIKDLEAGKIKIGAYTPVIPPAEAPAKVDVPCVDILKKDLCIRFPELRETMSYMNMVDELGEKCYVV